MLDPFERQINYLRVSVTDRCNLRCVYCMPAEGVEALHHRDILRFNEIVDVVERAVDLGVNKVRITGGEPLVRKGLVELVSMLSGVKGINDLSMTTNGVLLDQYAKSLKDVGLMRVNISLDTLDPDKFAQITRGGDLAQVFKGIQAAEDAGLLPIKLNCVVTQSSSEPDAQLVKEFGERHGFAVRFIHLMDLENGYFEPVEGGDGGNCVNCNRLRLTSNGLVKPCLFSNHAYSVRELGAKEALLQAISNKPACGGENPEGQFFTIGG